jgi:hypothetical protein
MITTSGSVKCKADVCINELYHDEIEAGGYCTPCRDCGVPSHIPHAQQVRYLDRIYEGIRRNDARDEAERIQFN